MIPTFATAFVLLFVANGLDGSSTNGCGGVPGPFGTSRCRAVDEWDGVCAKHRNFAGTSPNYVGLITFVQLLAFLEVPVIREYAGEDAVEFGKAGEKWTRDLCMC
jgi:hypothetical protein